MKTFGIPIAYLLALMVIGHLNAPPGYEWTQNTVSELASQGHERQWIMQVGFIGFGLLVNLAILSTFVAAKKIHLPDVPIMVYGLAILLAGLFSAAPIDPSIGYSATEAGLHSFFATASGISISLAIACYLLVSSRPQERLLHTAFLIVVMGLSLLFGLAESGSVAIGRGLVQRVLWLVGMSWLAAWPRFNVRSARAHAASEKPRLASR